MKITFCGVGEAFDEKLANTSLLVTVGEEAGRRTALLDCGFTAAHAFWSLAPDPGGLETVWVSHIHGDHFFGLPLLLLRYGEGGRNAPLTVIGPKGIGGAVTQAMDLAYPGFRSRLGYEVRFFEAEPGRTVESSGMRWSFAVNGHSAPCLAVRLDRGAGSLFTAAMGSRPPKRWSWRADVISRSTRRTGSRRKPPGTAMSGGASGSPGKPGSRPLPLCT
jgi:ribonuclease Z